MASKSKSIIGGMTVLGIAGIICKLVGVLFSIPLTYVIGAQGQGIYNAVFPTYNLLLTISSAGLPVAVSRMVSSALAKDDPHSAKHVFRVALLLLTTLGCLAAIIMLAGSGMLAARVNQPDSKNRLSGDCTMRGGCVHDVGVPRLYTGTAGHGADRHQPAD